MSKETAVEINNLSKHFRLPIERPAGLKQAFVNWTRGVKGYKEQKVLRDISFKVEKGDFFGIVGRNGSGKSTLLKLISGIYQPDGGSVAINGSLVSFIELGVGFNPELTGRENVYLNGALMGFAVKEIDDMYDDIVDFAELGEFMGQKLKNYSSGMQVRLAFSCAIRAKSDILVLDEVLAVGDEAFQRKCNLFFDNIKQDKTKTVVLVTHSMEAVKKYCDKAILINDGRIIEKGNPDKVADEYSLDNLKNKQENSAKRLTAVDRPKISARFVNEPLQFNTGELLVEIKYKNIDARPVYVKVAIESPGAAIMVANAKILYGEISKDTKEHTVNYRLPLYSFNWGEFRVVTLLVDEKENINLADYGYNNELAFRIRNAKDGEKIGGIMYNVGELTWKK